MKLENGHQIIKTRDDHRPFRLNPVPTVSDPAKPFCISPCTECSWAKANEPFGSQILRSRIEPWLTALVQTEHLSLLIGSGLTHAIHGITRNNQLEGMGSITFENYTDEISQEVKRVAEAAGRISGNFEDQLRVANELLRGLEILEMQAIHGDNIDTQVIALRTELTHALASFAESILEAERSLASSSTDKREEAFTYLVNFLMSFASRAGTRERLNIFTTNYDRYIEAGADVAGLRLIDRFVGTLEPVFRASRLDVDLHYNPPGIRGEPRYLEGVARFTKLHGSVDWVDYDGTIRRIGLPFGAPDLAPFLDGTGATNIDARRLMIFPNAAKDRETSHYPYVELFRDLATTICRPNSTLLCYGYSFGDEHINRVIEDMLTIPSAHLVIIAYDDHLGRVMATYDKLGRPAQVSLMIGDHLGDLRILVDRYLPKSAIDRTTFRMAELLKARWSTAREDGDNTQKPPANGKDSPS